VSVRHHGAPAWGPRPWVAFGVAAAAIVWAASGAGQSPATSSPPAAEQQPPDRPTFRLEANYVRVDAYPTANGQPVADLTAADFELLEDGTPQEVTQFERVEVRALTAREERRDPTSVADGREQAGDPRRRVFVIYLDTHHTTYAGSHAARKPLVEMLERLIGPDDLFAVVTPTMAARDIVFARRTELLDQALYNNWTWGQRDAWVRTDPEEQQLEICYPDFGTRMQGRAGGGPSVAELGYPGVAAQLIRRKREEEVVASLESLVAYLGVVREERKAVIMVTQGWQLYRPKPELTARREQDGVPGPGGLGTGPDGRITTNRANAGMDNRGMMSPIECAERAGRYANLDNFQRFTAMMERANRFNVSFYPFDSRGLAVGDTMMGDRDERIPNDPGEWPNRTLDPTERARRNADPMTLDQETLTRRLDSMRSLASNTDGLAIVNTNDLAGGARRIVDDLSTYYLLGYYSSNRDLDGKWRKITVRVKRPGVDVRARKGYRALRLEDMPAVGSDAATEAAGGAGGAAANAEADAVGSAVGSLAGARDGLPMHSRAAWFFTPAGEAGGGSAGAGRGHVWVAAEMDPALAREAGWAGGGTLTASVSTADGAALGETEASMAPGSRFVEGAVPVEAADGSEVVVRLRLQGAQGSLPLTDVVRFTVPSGVAASIGTPRLQRWGPSTGRKYLAAADPRFRRTDRLRVEVPVAPGATEVTAELLDRTGAPLTAIPVKAALLPVDDLGVAWAQADVTLAPLAVGDYVLRVAVTHASTSSRSLTGFRIVP
jgi:VWFA-related protein